MQKLLSFLFIFLPAIINGQDTGSLRPNHTIWTKELQRFVTYEGMVEYYQWSMDRKGLDDYLLELSNKPVQADWTNEEKLAYWINAYNAFTVKLVLTHFPIESIRDVNKGNPWDEVWFRLGDETYSLNKIEKDIIRKQFIDPRIHFALNCASRSCPPLLNEAYDPQRLDDQLYLRTLKFINNKKYNQIAPVAVMISEIFKWYREDFAPDVISFINQYSKTEVNPDAKVEYIYYDWSLNEQ